MNTSPRIHPIRHAALVTAFLGAFLASAPAADEILIDTDFKPAAATSAPVDLTGRSDEDGSLPLKRPSRVGAMKPSTVMAEATADKPPQYQAVFDVQTRPNNPEATADVAMSWDLRQAGLSSGTYELTYDLVLLSEPTQGASMGVNLAMADGKPIKTDVPVHAGLGIRAGIDKAGKFRVGSAVKPTSGETAMHTKFIINMDNHTWSAYLDDEMVVEDRAFPAPLLEVEPNPIISEVQFGSSGGLADKAPFKYALVNMRLVRKGK